MEIQIPLVIFTSLLAWSAGLFSTQCIYGLRKQGGAIQMASLVTSVVVLAVGGVAVVFHLTHPLHLFNGFGHLTSGITQELIAIVLLAVVMVLYFLMLRRSGDNSVPGWLCVVGVALSVVLLVAMGHSYLMASRPAWDTVLQILSLFGAACILGPATFALIASIKKVELPKAGNAVAAGACVNAVLSVVYMVAIQLSSGTFQSFEYYFDPTHPNNALISTSDVSLFSGDCLIATVLMICVLVVSLVVAFVGRKKNLSSAWCITLVILGVASAVILRVIMYLMGYTLFMLY